MVDLLIQFPDLRQTYFPQFHPVKSRIITLTVDVAAILMEAAGLDRSRELTLTSGSVHGISPEPFTDHNYIQR